MVPSKLVSQIEDHWDNIARRAVRRIRACTQLPHLQQMPESEIHQVGQRILHNLSHWLLSAPEKEIAERYQEIGRHRCHDGMPLHEAVRAQQLMRESTIDYLREHELTTNTVEMRAENELENELARFFDLMTFHLVRGYEEELRRSAHAHANHAHAR